MSLPNFNVLRAAISSGVGAAPPPPTGDPMMATRTSFFAPGFVGFAPENDATLVRTADYRYTYGEAWSRQYVQEQDGAATRDNKPNRAQVTTGYSVGPMGLHTYVTPGTFTPYRDKVTRSATAIPGPTGLDWTMTRTRHFSPTITVTSQESHFPTNRWYAIHLSGADTSWSTALVAAGATFIDWRTDAAGAMAAIEGAGNRCLMQPGGVTPPTTRSLAQGDGTYVGLEDFMSGQSWQIQTDGTFTPAFSEIGDNAVLANCTHNGLWIETTGLFEDGRTVNTGLVGSEGVNSTIFRCKQERGSSLLNGYKGQGGVTDCWVDNNPNYAVFQLSGDTSGPPAYFDGVVFAFDFENGVDYNALIALGRTTPGNHAAYRNVGHQNALFLACYFYERNPGHKTQPVIRDVSNPGALPFSPATFYTGCHFDGTPQFGSNTDSANDATVLRIENSFSYTGEIVRSDFYGLVVKNCVYDAPATIPATRFASITDASVMVSRPASNIARSFVFAYNTLMEEGEPSAIASIGDQGRVVIPDGIEYLTEVTPVQKGDNAVNLSPSRTVAEGDIDSGLDADGRGFSDHNLVRGYAQEGPPPGWDFNGTLRESAPHFRGAFHNLGATSAGLPADNSDSALNALLGGGIRALWNATLSDWSGLFQDTAGTTPVTAAGQPVGYIRDLTSRGVDLVLQGTPSASTADSYEDPVSGRKCVRIRGGSDFVGTLPGLLSAAPFSYVVASGGDYDGAYDTLNTFIGPLELRRFDDISMLGTTAYERLRLQNTGRLYGSAAETPASVPTDVRLVVLNGTGGGQATLRRYDLFGGNDVDAFDVNGAAVSLSSPPAKVAIRASAIGGGTGGEMLWFGAALGGEVDLVQTGNADAAAAILGSRVVRGSDNNLPAAPTPPADGLVASYDSDEAGGISASGNTVTRINDLSGNSWHIPVTGGAPQTGTRQINSRNVVDFSGSDRTINSFARPIIEAASPVSIMVARQSDAAVGSDAWSLLMQRAGGPSVFSITSATNNGGVNAVLMYRGSDVVIRKIGPTVSTGFDVIFATCDGTTGTDAVKLYYRGTIYTHTPSAALTELSEIALGDKKDGATGTWRIWNRVLSQSEINTIGAEMVTRWGSGFTAFS